MEKKSLSVNLGNKFLDASMKWVMVGFFLLPIGWSGILPFNADGRVPPVSSNGKMAEEVGRTPENPNESWSVFRSDEAKSICVTVVNNGASEIFVHLFRKRSLAGAFTVLPQRVSATCSDVTVVELECGSGFCQPQWYISESY